MLDVNDNDAVIPVKQVEKKKKKELTPALCGDFLNG